MDHLADSAAKLRQGGKDRYKKRNIQALYKDLKSVAYRTLVTPQLEYASTVLSSCYVHPVSC